MNEKILSRARELLIESEYLFNIALEMAEDVHKYMKSHKPTKYKCRKLAGGMLTK